MVFSWYILEVNIKNVPNSVNSVTRLKLYHQSVTKSTKLNLNLLESLSRAKPHSLFVPERDHTADALHQYCGKRQLQLEL